MRIHGDGWSERGTSNTDVPGDDGGWRGGGVVVVVVGVMIMSLWAVAKSICQL